MEGRNPDVDTHVSVLRVIRLSFRFLPVLPGPKTLPSSSERKVMGVLPLTFTPVPYFLCPSFVDNGVGETEGSFGVSLLCYPTL